MPTNYSDELLTRAGRIRLLLTDVDGVLTEGRLFVDAHGEPLKFFNVKDGLGLFLLGEVGIQRGIITGKTSRAVERRAKELRLDYCEQGVLDKSSVIEELLIDAKCTLSQTAYIGDDLNDLPLLTTVGLAACPADAVPEVKERVHLVCQQDGGRGAVRELCEVILKAQGHWEGLVERWIRGFNQLEAGHTSRKQP